MPTRQSQREQVILQLSAHLLKTGLAETSLRQLASAAGVSDRMLLYYFKDKAEILEAALGHVALHVTQDLEAYAPYGDKRSAADLIATTTGLVQDAKMRPFFRLWMETVAAAARDEAPYNTIARTIAEGFLSWIEGRLDINSDEQRQAMAAMILAMIDGLALLEICTDESRAQMAAEEMRGLIYPEKE